jgi:hypothetical protein
MTAEVCILNRVGVALAADSAVAIGVDAHKIFTSADKLFQLSRVEPVGIMVYGNAVFADLPWETIIKEYRSSLGTKAFRRLGEYSHDFLKFISSNAALLTNADRDASVRNLVLQLYISVREDIRKNIDRAATSGSAVDAAQLPRIVGKSVQARLSRVRQAVLMRGLSVRERSAMKARMRSDIRSLQESVFGKLPMNPSTRADLTSLAFEMLSREYLSSQRSGIVIAGFGRSEYRPRLLSYELDGLVRRRLRLMAQQNISIGPGGQASSVVPFAQQEMVHTFMQGIDSNMFDSIQRSTKGALKDLRKLILDSVSKRSPQLARIVRRNSEKGTKDLVQRLFQQWHESCERLWGPVVSIVSTLPKDELAAMAESLVNLTKFRRRITPARETVGGPIDVAVITKGDGFVWVKRKHYFDPDLNPRVMSRLRGEGNI